jgi:hypothetical protein
VAYSDILADVAEGNVWTLKVAFKRRKNGYRSRGGFSLAGENHGQVQYLSSALYARKAIGELDATLGPQAKKQKLEAHPAPLPAQ